MYLSINLHTFVQFNGFIGTGYKHPIDMQRMWCIAQDFDGHIGMASLLSLQDRIGTRVC